MAQTLTPCRFAAVPLGKGDKVLVENAGFVPLTKGDSREAAGGRDLSHFYPPSLGIALSYSAVLDTGMDGRYANDLRRAPTSARHKM